MRRLIHIPVVHSSVELGGLSESLQARSAKIAGPRAWSRREQVIAEFWKHVRASIRALPLGDQRLRIYQDGLPVCGFEDKIVRELAEAGSWNHQLIVELLNRGAVLEGTEDPQLLMEEYAMQKKSTELQTASDRACEEGSLQAQRLLQA